MNQITNFNGSEIRTVQIDGEIWYVAKDVCLILNLANYRDAIRDLDEDQKGVASTDTLGGPQQMSIINKSGAYTLALRSRKPEAKKFQRWLTDDVVPSIEQTGRYEHPKAEPPLTQVEIGKLMIQAGERILELEAQLKAQQPLHDFGQELVNTNTLLSMTQVGKTLGVTAQRIYHFLHAQKVVFKQGSDWFPYAKYDDSGYFKRIIGAVIKGSDGNDYQKYTLKATAKGQEFIHRLWRQEQCLTTHS